jgi:DNA-binding NtrC family response regulator
MLRAAQDQSPGLFDSGTAGLIGQSDAFLAVLERLGRLCASEAPVLICGETGTGKELFARALHYAGKRRGFPFIPVNCAALPDQLVENELFGHEKGAYTGAADRRLGLVAEAAGGTLFLDEVDSLSAHAQAALLRFLQDATYRPLGGGSMRIADTRIIAATNADLAGAVEGQRFRPDLFYRLSVIVLRIPPLRERGDDIILLAHHILGMLGRRYGCAARQLSPAAADMLVRCPWPGNVRELENRLHRAHVLSEGPQIEPADLDDVPAQVAAIDDQTSFAEARIRAIASFERGYLIRLLARTRGNISAASRLACKERRTFRRLLTRHGIDRRSFEAP